MAPPVATLLPALRPRVKYDGVPLRYEETKPVLIQAGAHRKILYIGEELHDREIQQLTREQEKAVYMAQETIWEQAEAMRVEAVEKALHVAQDEHDTAMRRMARAHERTLREEVTRIEGEAEIKFREQLAQEKITCDANLRRELDAMEIRWQDRLAEALNATRVMEREKAEARVLQAEREEEVRTNQALEELGAKHEKAMTELSQSYDVLVSEEIEKAKQEAAEKSETRINNTRDLYEQQLQVLRTHISEKNELIAKLQAALNGLVLERARLKTQLEHTHKEFETFVNSAIPVQDAAGFLLPSFRTKPKLKKLTF